MPAELINGEDECSNGWISMDTTERLESEDTERRDVLTVERNERYRSVEEELLRRKKTVGGLVQVKSLETCTKI